MDALESQDLLNDLLDKHANTGLSKPEDAETLEHLLATNTSGIDGNSSLRGLSGSALLQLLVGRFGLDASTANNLVTACTTGDVLATYGEADFAKCGIDIADPKLELLKQAVVEYWGDYDGSSEESSGESSFTSDNGNNKKETRRTKDDDVDGDLCNTEDENAAGKATASGAQQDEWVAQIDPDSGDTYYRNTRTSESRWTLPTADADAVDDTIPASTTAVAKSGWQAFWDPVQGLYCYRADIDEYCWPDGTEDEDNAPEYALPAITEAHISTLIDMGFAQDQAVAALFRFGGDCTRATESLLGAGDDGDSNNEPHDSAPTYTETVSDAEDSDELTSGVRQLVAMGYDVAAARDACARTESLSAAVELLTTMYDEDLEIDPKITQLTQMGFTEDQAREALAHTNEDVSEAINFCLQNFSSPLSPEDLPDDLPPEPPPHYSESKQHSADAGWGLLARARHMASAAREGDAKPIRTLNEAEFDSLLHEAEIGSSYDNMMEAVSSDSDTHGTDTAWTEPKRATALGAAGPEVLDLQKFYHAAMPPPEKQLAQQIEALLVPLAGQCEHLLTGPELNATVGPGLSPVTKALQSLTGDDENWHLKPKQRRERSRALMKYDTELRAELAHRQKQWVLCGEMLKSLAATREEHSLWLRSWGLMRHLPFFDSRFKLCIDRANALKTLHYQAGHRLTQKLHSIKEVLVSLKAISEAKKTKSRTDKELYSITFADAVTAASKVSSQDYFTSVEAMLRSHPEIGHCLKSIHAYNSQLRALDAHALRLRDELAPPNQSDFNKRLLEIVRNAATCTLHDSTSLDTQSAQEDFDALLMDQRMSHGCVVHMLLRDIKAHKDHEARFLIGCSAIRGLTSRLGNTIGMLDVDPTKTETQTSRKGKVTRARVESSPATSFDKGIQQLDSEWLRVLNRLMEGLIFRYIYDTAQRKGGEFEVAEEADKKWKQQRRELGSVSARALGVPKSCCPPGTWQTIVRLRESDHVSRTEPALVFTDAVNALSVFGTSVVPRAMTQSLVLAHEVISSTLSSASGEVWDKVLLLVALQAAQLERPFRSIKYLESYVEISEKNVNLEQVPFTAAKMLRLLGRAVNSLPTHASSKPDDLEEFVVSKQHQRAMRRMLESRTCREALRAWSLVHRTLTLKDSRYGEYLKLPMHRASPSTSLGAVLRLTPAITTTGWRSKQFLLVTRVIGVHPETGATSTASAAGLQAEDIIVDVNGQEVNDFPFFTKLTKMQTRFTFGVVRPSRVKEDEDQARMRLMHDLVELGFKSQSVADDSDDDDSEELSQDSEGSDSKSTSDLDNPRDTTPADTDSSLQAPHASKYQSRLPRPLHSDPKWATFLEDVFDVHEPKDLSLARSGMSSSLLQSEMPLELSLGLR